MDGEMVSVCSTHGLGKECVEVHGRTARRKETTVKAKTYTGG
jgi:hypothetical protein